jgi:DNA/RNA endonuclease YhcR with UshA esterase domain
MSSCPSCGRDPGASDLCPYCGADLKRRLQIRTFGLVAIVIAVLGLIGLGVFATRQPIPAVKIADVQSTYNFAYVQINGRVSRVPSYNATSQTLTFWVRDETGELMVSSFRATTQGLITADRVPAPGDTVAVQGTLRVRETTPSLTLDAPEALILTRAAAETASRDIGSLTADDALRAVTVRGVVRSIRSPFDGLQLITLRDATGAIDLALPAELEPIRGALPPLDVGQSIEVSGAVTLFDATPQLSLRRSADIQPLSERVAFARFMPLSDLNESSAGRWARVESAVEEVAPFSAGVKLTLSDGHRRISVLLWQDLWVALDKAAAIQPGTTLSVQGAVSVFHGQLEIVPEIPQDVAVLQVAVLAPTPLPTIEPTATTVAVLAATAIAAPTAMPSTLTSTPTTQVIVAATATATPRPATATPTKEPKPTTASTVQLVSISALTTDSAGQIVTVRGKVVESSSFSAGFKFLIDDGTGRIMLTLFSDNYKFVPNRSGLNLGAEVSIEAKVAEYKGVLELQPNSGRDVIILTPGSSAGVPLTTINQLKKPGQFVAIEGRITDVKPFSAGLNVFVDDGTGNVRVTLFTSVLAYVPNRDGLVVGANVRVVGKTDFYGSMQVVPALGYDVNLK